MSLQGKLKGVADVVFVIDVSGSMAPVIEAVKKHISTFVESIHRHSQMPIDLRLGLVAHYASGGSRQGTREWPFTDSVDEFCRHLADCESVAGTYDEFGLPALDAALDFPWRSRCRRFVVSFTDEPVKGGHEPDLQCSKLQDLMEKFAALSVNGYVIGPSCPDYDRLCTGPRMVRVTVEQVGLARHDFQRFLSELGRTVSQSGEQGQGPPVKTNLYAL